MTSKILQIIPAALINVSGYQYLFGRGGWHLFGRGGCCLRHTPRRPAQLVCLQLSPPSLVRWFSINLCRYAYGKVGPQVRAFFGRFGTGVLWSLKNLPAIDPSAAVYPVHDVVFSDYREELRRSPMIHLRQLTPASAARCGS